ncbi:Hypothetical predicted protein [Podarcis lilfordi]|uniref:Uncharacterized protein n=1 Tax=Podarcis lilfordi TaxID=74358 RepID=A0AA35KAN5_9SAUR|nr:Hypothetical predicted protein [Podarcis lilfordi]
MGYQNYTGGNCGPEQRWRPPGALEAVRLRLPLTLATGHVGRAAPAPEGHRCPIPDFEETAASAKGSTKRTRLVPGPLALQVAGQTANPFSPPGILEILWNPDLSSLVPRSSEAESEPKLESATPRAPTATKATKPSAQFCSALGGLPGTAAGALSLRRSGPASSTAAWEELLGCVSACESREEFVAGASGGGEGRAAPRADGAFAQKQETKFLQRE